MVKAAPLPSRADLLRIFRYDPVNGILYWRDHYSANPQTRSRLAGHQAGRVLPESGAYVQVRYRRHAYAAHRLMWVMVHGKEPRFIDHIDGDRTNNKLTNLRECSHSENIAAKRTKPRDLPRGVVWHKCGKFQAQLGINNGRLYLGLFDTAEAAGEAYRKAAIEHFGEFAGS